MNLLDISLGINSRTLLCMEILPHASMKFDGTLYISSSIPLTTVLVLESSSSAASGTHLDSRCRVWNQDQNLLLS